MDRGNKVLQPEGTQPPVAVYKQAPNDKANCRHREPKDGVKRYQD